MKLRFLSVAAAALMFAACNEPLNEAAENLEKDSNESESVSTKSHWGNKINDPYTVSNMRLAFKELMKKKNNSLSKAGVNEQQIEPTHLHLKFIPKNESEWRLLKMDTILNVVPVPFDYDLEGFNGEYRDPECPENQPTYQYSVVRINHKLPNVEYVVLDSLFMPFEDDYDQETISKKAGFKQVWDDLETESLKLTGNLDEEVQYISKKSRKTPDGHVRMTDFSLGKDSLAVPDVKIYMNFSTHHETAYTDVDGHYKMPRGFKNKVHTHVYFENGNYFAGNKKSSVIAYYRGRITPGEINYTFNEKNEKNYAATIMRAGYDYYNNNKGLIRPPSNKFYCIGLEPNSNGSAIYYTTEFGGHYGEGDKVKIFIIESEKCKRDSKSRGFEPKDEDIFGKNKEIYATAIYGLSYASLLNFSKKFVQGTSLFNESYLACVSWCMTKPLYDDYDPRDFRHNYKKNNSGFFIDMIDEIDDSEGDNVCGYTIGQIEALIANKEICSLQSVVEEMPAMYDNETATNLEELCTHWDCWSYGYYSNK